MTTASDQTFKNGAKRRETNKQIVLEAVKSNPKRSRFGIGEITGLGDIEAQRRLSDLKGEGKVIETGTRKHFNRDISLYSEKIQQTIFETKETLLHYCKRAHPNIIEELKMLNEHKL